MADTAPTPDIAAITRFLLTCPMLRRLSQAQVAPLAAHVRMRRYPCSSYLLRDEIPNRETPLRIVVHGNATWRSNDSRQQKGAWMQRPGSIIGVAAVNDWAYHAGVEDTWPQHGLAKIHCEAAGELTVLELPPDRFDAVFGVEAGETLQDTLVSMVPTVNHASSVVDAMRETVQFAQITPHMLYRLLEYAPTHRFSAPVGDAGPKEVLEAPGPQQQFAQAQQAMIQAPVKEIQPAKKDDGEQGKLVEHGPAMFYVIDGELLVDINEQTIALRNGEIGGPDLFAPAEDYNRLGASATVRTSAIVVTQDSVVEMMRCTPGFARKLGPRHAGKRVSP